MTVRCTASTVFGDSDKVSQAPFHGGLSSDGFDPVEELMPSMEGNLSGHTFELT
jgi:hypothetical protein